MSRGADPLLRRRGDAGDFRLGPARPVRSSRHRLLVAEAGYVSHLFQHSLDSQQQVGAAAGGPFGVHSDGRQSVRSFGRLQCRHLAGAGDRAARPGLAVVGGGLGRACDGRGGRARERPPDHPGEDRFVHRHARNRHDSLWAQRLVHRRAAGARFAAARVPGHFRQRLDRAGAGDLRVSSSASRCGSCSNTCRSAAISMCSARARGRRSSTAFRPGDT